MSDERPLTFVAVLTTGPSPEQDDVLEVAAVRRRGGEEAERFSQLANPGDAPPAVLKLADLSASRLAGRPSPRAALEKLFDFIGHGPFVVHDAALLKAFAAGRGLCLPGEAMDSQMLARIVRPVQEDYRLPELAAALGLQAPAVQRALELALVLAQVWQALVRELKQRPAPVLDALHRVAAAVADPLAPLLAEAANEVGGFKLSSDETPALIGCLKDHRELLARAQKYESPEPRDEPLDADGICAMFSAEGALGRNLRGYEQRDEQVTMARAVCEALSDGAHLLCEAGTGTGKSLAYLMPCIGWSCHNEDKVVVSTNTKNLQEQLYRKDLPFLHALLGDRFEAALLKGRGNYLCVRRFLHLVRHFERELSTPEEMAALLPLISWSERTESGDLAECAGLMVGEGARTVIDRATSSGDDCLGRACPLRGRCFVMRARALAQLADVVVVNHALLFSDVGLDQPILPLYRCVVFDEAHNVEDVATEAMAAGVDSLSVYRIANRLWRVRRQDGSGSGLLASVLYEVDKRLLPGGPLGKETVVELARDVIEKIEPVVQLTKDMLQTLARPFEAVPAWDDKIMMAECDPKVGSGSPTGQAAEVLAEAVTRLCGSIESLAVCLEENQERLPAAPELCADLRAQAGRLREVMEQVEFVQAQGEPNYVYWIERTRRRDQEFYGMHAAPLDVGRFLRTTFFDARRTVIMTSATLRVGGSFGYMQERLGADLGEERLRCLAVGSPFDYDRQTLVAAPTFLPEAGGRREEGFDEELAVLLTDLFVATSGRGLVLCTSYSLLNSLYDRIKRPLERAGIPVLAQGRDGSRERISALFRQIKSSVLLGTQSFWEGVDFTGDTLSCLVLTKLPFHVFTEPLVRGRIEYLRSRGLEPFTHYTLPEAVINFRQGFGRLIRNRTDRGVVVVTDRRIVTKSYGRAFLSDLPTRCQVFREKGALIDAVRRFFARPAPEKA